jgi:hypothetical protein
VSEYLLIGVFIVAGGIALPHLLCPLPNPLAILLTNMPPVTTALDAQAAARAQAAVCHAALLKEFT